MPLPSIQKPAPAFTGEALLPSKEFGKISLSDFAGKWVVFFWYPLDFTFVCPTEIIAFGDRQPEFSAINTQVIAASCDSIFTHLAWVNTSRSEGGLGDMKIPIVADFDKKIATSYGVLLEDGGDAGVPLRALFIISPTGVLRQVTVNDLPVGRNVDEIIRLVKAFQYVDVHGEVCPANWQPGDLTMNADPSKSKAYFSAVNPTTQTVAAVANTVENVSDALAFSSLTSSGLVVVDYWAPWCKNCKKVAPLVDRLAAELTSIKFLKVNTVEAGDIGADNGVDVLPTLQFYKAGVKIGTYSGSDAAAIENAIRSL